MLVPEGFVLHNNRTLAFSPSHKKKKQEKKNKMFHVELLEA